MPPDVSTLKRRFQFYPFDWSHLCILGLKLGAVLENSRNLKRSLIAASLGLTLAVSGCSTLPENAPLTKVDYRACLVTEGASDIPGINELATYALNQSVVAYGVKKSHSEATFANFPKRVSELVKDECRLIAVASNNFDGPVDDASEKYPEVNFLLITEGDDPKQIRQERQNLAVHRIDVFTAGVLAGHISASLSTRHEIAVVCAEKVHPLYLDGVRAGAKEFDLEANVQTLVRTDEQDLAGVDVALPFGCEHDLTVFAANELRERTLLVGYGRDLFEKPQYGEIKGQLGTTIIPTVVNRFVESVAADLEGDFIGGFAGSVVADYNSGDLKLAPEHELVLPLGEIEKLSALAAKFETTVR
jgi:hypothetical protein